MTDLRRITLHDVLRVCVHRDGATVAELQAALHALPTLPASMLPTVPSAPTPRRTPESHVRAALEGRWPELGFYDPRTSGPPDAHTTDLRDALDDLTVVVSALTGAVTLAATDPAAGHAWLHHALHGDAGSALDHLRRHVAVLTAAEGT